MKNYVGQKNFHKFEITTIWRIYDAVLEFPASTQAKWAILAQFLQKKNMGSKNFPISKNGSLMTLIIPLIQQSWPRTNPGPKLSVLEIEFFRFQSMCENWWWDISTSTILSNRARSRLSFKTIFASQRSSMQDLSCRFVNLSFLVGTKITTSNPIKIVVFGPIFFWISNVVLLLSEMVTSVNIITETALNFGEIELSCPTLIINDEWKVQSSMMTPALKFRFSLKGFRIQSKI